MQNKVRSTIQAYGMVQAGDRVGVAVSGGADSVCLLHILNDLAPDIGFVLHVLHLNHGWRGEESDADAEFVASLASRLGLPFTVERASIPQGGNLEQAGRIARLDFFRRIQSEAALGRIATGHTRSDQAETVLYRLLRGSGTAGLSGIRPVTDDGRIRPLLHCSRAEVETWLRANGHTWREDRTNADPSFDRNRIRNQLIPLLERDFQPALSDILAATAELAQDEETWWAEEVKRLVPDLIERKDLTSLVLRADKLSSLATAPARRVIRRVLADVRGDLRGLDLTHVERVRQLAAQHEGHGRTQIPGADVFRSFEWLRIAPLQHQSRSELDYAFSVQREELKSPEGWVRKIPHTGFTVLLQMASHDVVPGQSPYNEEAAQLDAGTFTYPVELRNWYPGDKIELPGRAPVKLKLLFQEFRIPIWERHLWPVLTCGEEVVWSRQFGPSAKHQTSSDTRSILHLRLREIGIGNPDSMSGETIA